MFSRQLVSASSSVVRHFSGTRIPLIKFLGKRSLLAKASAPAASAPIFRPIKEGNGVDFFTLPNSALFGRPLFSDSEIEAIESGGATLA